MSTLKVKKKKKKDIINKWRDIKDIINAQSWNIQATRDELA